MSYRINRVMGWGMPWNDFEANTLLDCEAHETNEALYNLMDKSDPKKFVIPKKVISETWKTRNVPSILTTNILDRKFNFGPGRKKRDVGPATDLYDIISSPDEYFDIVFFPNLNYREKWHRYDDDMDYAFEQWRGDDLTRKNDDGPREFTKYLPYGFYPYANFLMLEDGTPVEWKPYWELEKRDDIFPAVPSEIRWWTKNLGIFDDAGVNKLRPVIAQYWC